MIILEDEDGVITTLSGSDSTPLEFTTRLAVPMMEVAAVSGPRGERGERGPAGEPGGFSTVDIPNFVLLFENKLI